VLLVQLKLPAPLGADEIQRLRLGLGARAGLADSDDVQLEVLTVAAARKNTKATRR
jgi:hypothetical protein